MNGSIITQRERRTNGADVISFPASEGPEVGRSTARGPASVVSGQFRPKTPALHFRREGAL